MHTTAFFIAIFVAMFVSLVAGFFPLMLILGKRGRAAERRARARRLSDARMNARLLRLNL
jgi:cytochrome c biogenesis protein ResB